MNCAEEVREKVDVGKYERKEKNPKSFGKKSQAATGTVATNFQRILMFFNVQAHIANYYNTFALLVNILRCVGENFNNKLFLLLCFLFFFFCISIY